MKKMTYMFLFKLFVTNIYLSLSIPLMSVFVNHFYYNFSK